METTAYTPHPCLKTPRRRARQRSGGFTLLETMLATALISLVLLGVVDLFLNSARLTNRTGALMSASADSANAVQQVIDKAREANGMLLPDDTGFTPIATYSDLGSYKATAVNGQSVYTAMQINRPAGQSPTVHLPSGGTMQLAAYDRLGAVTQHYLFYRGDASQAPRPNDGQYLWKYDSATGTTTAICRTIDSQAPDAVQFVQPLAAQAAQTTAEATQVEIKLVTRAASLINGQQTSERTDGSNTSALTGECVLMRNYNPSAVQSTSKDVQSLNRAFQPN